MNDFVKAMGAKKRMQEPEPEAASAPDSEQDGAGRSYPSVDARKRQKHIGGYFDKSDEVTEQIAILRARLDMNNSDLIRHAINELWKAHEAKRRFGE